MTNSPPSTYAGSTQHATSSPWSQATTDFPISDADILSQYATSSTAYNPGQPQAFSPVPGSLFGTYSLADLAASGYQTLPSRQQLPYSLPTNQSYLYPTEPHIYPLQSPSERHSSLFMTQGTSAIVPSSNRSRAQQNPQRRDRTPPRNSAGQIYCDHLECVGKNVVFRRLCEYNKHMDKHERPWKCNEPGCEASPGFTYSGGLLRHQREVHKMHLNKSKALFCPYPNCNRSSGTGFTRRENLEEHKRRRHVGQSESSAGILGATGAPSPATTTASSESPLSATAASTLDRHSMPPPPSHQSSAQRKRQRHDPQAAQSGLSPDNDDDDDVEDDEDITSDITSGGSVSGSVGGASSTQRRVTIESLRRQIAQRDQIIQEQREELRAIRQGSPVSRAGGTGGGNGSGNGQGRGYRVLPATTA